MALAISSLAMVLITSSAWLTTPGTMHAQDTGRVLSLQNDVVVHEDGSMTVTETIRTTGPTRVARDFQTIHPGLWGSRVIVELNVLDVRRDGQPDKYEIEPRQNGVRLKLPGDGRSGEHTYTLVYRIHRQLDFFPDHDELYWNVTAGWAVPFTEVSATIVLPDAVPPDAVTLDGRTGLRSSPGRNFEAGKADAAGATFTYRANRPLEPGEGFEVLVAWPKGFVSEPDTLTRLRHFVLDYPPGAGAGIFGCVLIVAFALGALSYVTGHLKFSEYLFLPYIAGAGELTVFCAAVIGASLGFLWFNCHPASIFMGDVGSLPLGGTLGMIAVLIKKELLLVILGGVFVIEALSVILQVASFRIWGKRILKMSPFHHHLQLSGWHESKIIIRLWILAIIFALITLTTLKIR